MDRFPPPQKNQLEFNQHLPIKSKTKNQSGFNSSHQIKTGQKKPAYQTKGKHKI